jgi:hypothetical protein
MKFLIVTLLLLQNVISSPEEVQDTDEVFRSPIGRHVLQNFIHFLLFLIHDISSIVFCILIGFQFLRGKDRLHIIYGFIFLGCFFIALTTGFCLIYMRSKDEKLHENSKGIIVYSITTQGYCVIALFLHSFILGKRTLNKNFILFLKIFHYFNIITGIRSFIFLTRNILREANTDKDLSIREFSLEMSFTLTWPQLIIEAIYLYIIRQLEKQDFKNFSWHKHHKLGIVLLVIMTVPGLVSNIVHDSYWFFPPPGINSVIARIFILVAPLWIFMWTQRDIFKYIVELKTVKEKIK